MVSTLRNGRRKGVCAPVPRFASRTSTASGQRDPRQIRAAPGWRRRSASGWPQAVAVGQGLSASRQIITLCPARHAADTSFVKARLLFPLALGIGPSNGKRACQSKIPHHVNFNERSRNSATSALRRSHRNGSLKTSGPTSPA